MKNTKSDAKFSAKESRESIEIESVVVDSPEHEPDFPFADIPKPVSIVPQPGTALQRWMPILIKFTSVQVIVQVLGFAAGIIVIRNLPKREYALYTLGNMMLSTVLVLADSGISSALTAIGGRIWQDNHQLSRLIETAIQLRRWLATIALPVVIPVLVWLLIQNGASISKTVILVVLVLAGCGLELITRIYAVALRLKSEIRKIQNQALASALVKLAIVGIALLFGFNVEIAIFAVIAGYAAQYWMLHRWVTKNLDAHASSDLEMRADILAVVKKAAPHTVYYCLQGQITVWLISFFGNADSVADVGALARLAVVLSILGSLTSEILFPAFARIQSVEMLRRRYLQVILAFTCASALLVSVVALFPGPVLFVLGNQYSHLQTEGVLMAISSVLGAIAGLLIGLNAARAWIVSPLPYYSVLFVMQASLVFVFKMSTVRGVLLFSIFSAVPAIVWSIWFTAAQMRKMQQLHSE